jgi:cation-transporting P-type ATPase E
LHAQAPRPGERQRQGAPRRASTLVRVSEARLTGLTQVEARRRLEAAPPAEPTATSRSYASIVRSNTLTLFNLILGGFFVLIVAAGRPADGLFAGILVANAAIGILQDVRAKRALDRLALLIAPHARAVRDGAERLIPAGEVVDGDIVALRPGDQVVADGAVVESAALRLDESQLTGESRPVAKEIGDEILSGSFCVEGAGRYLVNRTGESSYASQVVGEAREFRYRRSPLEQQINRLLLVTVGVMIPLGAAFVWVLIRHDSPFRSAAATATAGIVTLVPEGLVLLTSLTFAVAAVRLSGRGMLVQSFNAVESLANVDTVCLDKTGTLTDGTLALHGITPVGPIEAGAAEQAVRDYAASTTSRNDTVDAIARALPGSARPVHAEVPFSSRWKWSAARLDGDDQTLVMGAPDVLLGAAAPALVSEHERAGRRTLVLARTPALLEPPEDGAAAPAVEPVAVIALEEHVRPEAAPTIAFLREQGVAVKVMSGDSPTTVAAVAARAGVTIEGDPVDGADLPEPGPELDRVAGSATVFARLSPQHKRMLVESLGASGRYVAMIGDGVNDVPAMKGSRLAIALGSGAQMAKSVADSVLVTDSFAALPAAVAEGRQIILNIQRVARLFVTKTVFAACVILAFGLTTAGFPLLPRHLTLAATVTVGIPGFVIALIPSSERPDQGSFLRRVARFSIPAGAVIAAAVLAAYLLERAVRVRSITDARTAAVTVFVALGLYLLLVLDAERMSASRAYAVGILSLVGVLAAAYLGTLSAEPARDFFALARPDLLDAAIMVVATVAGIRLMAWAGLSPYARPPQTVLPTPPEPSADDAATPPSG